MALSSTEIKTIIAVGTEHRGWIANSFAQIEFLLGDLIVRCRVFPEYRQHTRKISQTAAERVRALRAILEIDGPLSAFKVTLEPLLEEFSDVRQVRNLLSHGFCEFHYTAAGDAGFHFRMFDRTRAVETGDDAALLEKTFSLIDLQNHSTRMITLSKTVMVAIANLHVYLGWGEAVPHQFDNIW